MTPSYMLSIVAENSDGSGSASLQSGRMPARKMLRMKIPPATMLVWSGVRAMNSQPQSMQADLDGEDQADQRRGLVEDPVSRNAHRHLR